MARVLFVDDDENIRLLVREDLTLDGHSVRVAPTGIDGIEEVEKEQPDIIILDIKMPGLSGLEVLRRLKKTHPHLPVFLFTAYDGFRDQASELGADGYFIKSPDLFEMKRAIRRVTGDLAH